MKRHVTRLAICLLLPLGTLAGCARPDPLPLPASYPELGFTILDRRTGDVEWPADGGWILYPKCDPDDWFFDIWRVRPDGTDMACLTCGDETPQKHNGSVTRHPDGEFLVFTAQNADASGELIDRLAKPGIGLNCNLWAMTPNGSRSWQLTHMPTDTRAPQGVIHPQFSHDGTRLCRAQAEGRWSPEPGKEWGEWSLQVADFVVEGGAPRLENVRHFQPGDVPRFYESHGWSLPSGDARVLFTANPEAGDHLPNGLDVYTLDVRTGALTCLTRTPQDWDEHAHYSPDGATIAWMSGAELNVEFPSVRWPDWTWYVTTELWLMDTDGSNARRVTFFNEPGHPHHAWLQEVTGGTDRAVVSDSAWSPDGRQILFTLAYEVDDGPARNLSKSNSFLVLMDLGDAL